MKKNVEDDSQEKNVLVVNFRQIRYHDIVCINSYYLRQILLNV